MYCLEGGHLPRAPALTREAGPECLGGPVQLAQTLGGVEVVQVVVDEGQRDLALVHAEAAARAPLSRQPVDLAVALRVDLQVASTVAHRAVQLPSEPSPVPWPTVRGSRGLTGLLDGRRHALNAAAVLEHVLEGGYLQIWSDA